MSFEVENIISKRFIKGKVQYRLKWFGFPSKHNSWEPIEHMNCEYLIKQFELNKNAFAIISE